MSARMVCSGTRPSRYHSRRAISAPPNRPEQAIRMPSAPSRNAEVTAFFMAPEGHALLELEGHVLRHQLRVELGMDDLFDVEVDLLGRAHLDLVLELLHLGALPADDDAGARGEDGDAGAIG